MPTGAHDPRMGTNERRLDMLEKRARDVVTAKAAREAKRVVGIWNATHAANRFGSIPPLALRLPRNALGYILLDFAIRAEMADDDRVALRLQLAGMAAVRAGRLLRLWFLADETSRPVEPAVTIATAKGERVRLHNGRLGLPFDAFSGSGPRRGPTYP
jgi:hypothetical protein